MALKRARVVERGQRPRILIVDPDPYLAFLLRLDIPEAEIREADESVNINEFLGTAHDLVMVDLEGRYASQVLEHPNAGKVVGIIDGARASRTAVPRDLEGVLLRPFVPAELYRSIRRVLELEQRSEGVRSPAMQRIQGLLGPARVAGIALAAILEVTIRVDPLRSLVLAIAFSYVAIRLLFRKTGDSLAWVDVSFAMGVVALTGGLQTNYVGFALVIAIQSGLVLGMNRGGLAGILIALGTFQEIIGAISGQPLEVRQILSWFTLFPLAAIAGGLAARIWGAEGRESADILTEANRVLSTLYRITRAMPGGLEIGSVASAALAEVRETIGAPAGLLLLQEAGVLAVAGSYGMAGKEEALLMSETSQLVEFLDSSAVLRVQNMPAEIAEALGSQSAWIVTPLLQGSTKVGYLLAGSRDEKGRDADRVFLRQLGTETALAIENARLFARVRELSVDEERQRLARELHDGVAQALTHVRLELEFLAIHAPEESVRTETSRLARVVERATKDVRTTITGLRSAVSGEGLAGSLRSYLRDLRGLGGPEIDFNVWGAEISLPPDLEAELFRIVQEAVSNSLRHSQASRITVAMEAAGQALRISVEDDGLGLRATTGGASSSTEGMGMGAMRERARRVGASLSINEVASGGTRVQLLLDAGRLDSGSTLEEVRPA